MVPEAFDGNPSRNGARSKSDSTYAPQVFPLHPQKTTLATYLAHLRFPALATQATPEPREACTDLLDSWSGDDSNTMAQLQPLVQPASEVLEPEASPRPLGLASTRISFSGQSALHATSTIQLTVSPLSLPLHVLFVDAKAWSIVSNTTCLAEQLAGFVHGDLRQGRRSPIWKDRLDMPHGCNVQRSPG